MTYKEFTRKRNQLIERLRKLNVKADNLTLLKTTELERLYKYHKESVRHGNHFS